MAFTFNPGFSIPHLTSVDRSGWQISVNRIIENDLSSPKMIGNRHLQRECITPVQNEKKRRGWRHIRNMKVTDYLFRMRDFMDQDCRETGMRDECMELARDVIEQWKRANADTDTECAC